MVDRYVPGVESLRTYQRKWFRSDLVAGIVLAAILVPQGMAYAELAGLPPVNGLYTTIACLVGYALMGPSKILVLGPDSSLGPLIFAAVVPLVVAGDDPAKAVTLAAMLAIIVGLIEIGLGVGKLGFVADLLSSEVQIGYMNGLAITIVVGQLPKLSGFSTDADTFVEEVREFLTNFDQRDATALTVGLVTLGVLLLLPRITKKIPAVLVAVVGATAATAVFDFDIGTVGSLPEGLPTPEMPWTDLGDVVPLLIAAIGITLVSLTDTIALSTSFNARRGEQVRPNQEMIGIGAANIAAGVFQGFAISSSSSRTAVAEQSGAKSQLTGLVGAGMVVLLLLFFNGLLADLPNSALAAVVIAAAFSLADFAVLARVWQVRRSAVMLSVVASLGVMLLGVLEGILVAVVLSILLFFQRNWWPHGEVLGRVPGRTGWHSAREGTGLVERPDVVVFRWEAPLFFANSGMFADQVRELAAERRPTWVVLQCEAITDIDVTAAGMLERLDNELNAKGVHLAFVEMRTRLRDLVHDYGLFQTLDRDHFYGSIEEALADLDRAPVNEDPL
ncbi:MAG: sodium-independent anion transporter [Acidimicrobiaceae bacterium]|nr:sodium-independent anion transporter [Acidimicrobiaceae bacterium]